MCNICANILNLAFTYLQFSFKMISPNVWNDLQLHFEYIDAFVFLNGFISSPYSFELPVFFSLSLVEREWWRCVEGIYLMEMCRCTQLTDNIFIKKKTTWVYSLYISSTLLVLETIVVPYRKIMSWKEVSKKDCGNVLNINLLWDVNMILINLFV